LSMAGADQKIPANTQVRDMILVTISGAGHAYEGRRPWLSQIQPLELAVRPTIGSGRRPPPLFRSPGPQPRARAAPGNVQDGSGIPRGPRDRPKVGARSGSSCGYAQLQGLPGVKIIYQRAGAVASCLFGSTLHVHPSLGVSAAGPTTVKAVPRTTTGSACQSSRLAPAAGFKEGSR
jgi:hypothetical protein